MPLVKVINLRRVRRLAEPGDLSNALIFGPVRSAPVRSWSGAVDERAHIDFYLGLRAFARCLLEALQSPPAQRAQGIGLRRKASPRSSNLGLPTLHRPRPISLLPDVKAGIPATFRSRGTRTVATRLRCERSGTSRSG